jgi:hypothetical protein
MAHTFNAKPIASRRSGLVGEIALSLLRWMRRLRIVPEPRERRRAHRVLLATPVFVYGWLRGEPFSEMTDTLNVSAIGGALILSANAIPEQTLIVTNEQSNGELACRVTRAARTQDGRTVIGFEFLHVSPTFWQVDFVSSLQDVLQSRPR